MTGKFRITKTLLLCLVLAMSLFMPASSGSAAADKLPDLGIAKIKNIQIQTTADGRRLLRFTTIIANVGAGPFEVLGLRPDTSTTQMSTSQRIYDDAGGFRDVATSAQMIYSGDGHNHWHLVDLESYELIRKDNGVKVGTGTKIGFCFFDGVAFRLTLPGAPQSPVYNGCGNRSSLTVRTGLSVGWGDSYPAKLPGQEIDITGLVAGRYRLQVTSDGKHYFQESNESNNVSWVDIQLLSKTGTDFKIIGRSPAL